MKTIQEDKIIIEIPRPPITALVFEGGGIKCIAYAGALRVFKEKNGLFDHLRWVAGSSAGAVTALMVALDYSPDEIEKELTETDFAKITGTAAQTSRLGSIYGYITKLKNISSIHQGMYDGKELYKWVKQLVKKKLGNEKASFFNLQENVSKSPNYKNLLVIASNASKNKTEIFSLETTPHLQLADAVLVSMSIPGYFWTRYIDKDKMQRIDWEPTTEKLERKKHKLIPYVDGGVLNNYPIEIFCDRKYWLPEYYGLTESHSHNPSALGFRIDSKAEVDFILEEHDKALREGYSSPVAAAPSLWQPIEYIEDKLSSLINFFTSDLNKVEQYSRVTIGIEDCDIKTTNFSLTEENKIALREKGSKAASDFYNKFLKKAAYKQIIYNGLADLEQDYKKLEEIMVAVKNLNSKDTHFYELIIPALELKRKVINQKIQKLTH
jgi:NTE family protein